MFIAFNVYDRFFLSHKADKSVEQYKKKFENVKANAKKRQKYIAKQKLTGGGKLTKQEERIVNSTAYADLVLKLGVCASGNDARMDSDAGDSNSNAPTTRLDRLLSTIQIEYL